MRPREKSVVSTVKQVAMATQPSFTSALNPPTNLATLVSFTLVSPISALQNRCPLRKLRLVPDLVDPRFVSPA